MTNAIVTNVEERCQCGFTRSNITTEGFLCFPASVNTVTYRGEIHETDTVNVFDLIKLEKFLFESNRCLSSRQLPIGSSDPPLVCRVLRYYISHTGLEPMMTLTSLQTKELRKKG